jgi:hypothetical protein
MSEDIKIIKYDGKDTFEPLAELLQSIHKVLPNLVFKHEDFHTYRFDKAIYPDGVCYRFQVFHDTDQNNSIGRLFIENWHSKTPKYGIQNVNIADGRSSWGGDGQYKQSIHAKNIIRIAKKVFKPYTFEQIAQRSIQTFKSKIDSLGNGMRWDLRNNTCDGYEHLIEDWENLYHMGYTPKNAKFKQMMEYIIANKARIDKYHKYDPDHYFVLVKDNQVQYRLNKDKGQPAIVVNSKDELPDNIKGKLFVLDITDKQDFVEDVGLKENNGAYWIIA